MEQKTKSPRCQHLHFFRLAAGERFDIGLTAFKKVGAFSARNSITGALRRVLPWNKIRSRRLVKPKSEAEKVCEFVDEFCGTGCQGDGEKPPGV